MRAQYTKNLLLVSLLSLISGITQAREEGDWLIRVGRVDASARVGKDRDIDIAGIDTLMVSQVYSKDGLPGLSLAYTFAKNWGAELDAAFLVEHNFWVRGTERDPSWPLPLNGGSFKQLPLNFSLVWYPFGGGDRRFQPFIGAGINYTRVWDDDLDGAVGASIGRITEPLTGSDEPLRANIKVDDAWGLSGRIGFDYMFTERWGVSASFSYLDQNSDATIRTELGNSDFDLFESTNLLMLGITFEF